MELMPLNIAGKILLDLLKVNENLMGGKVSLTWTPLSGTNPGRVIPASARLAHTDCTQL